MPKMTSNEANSRASPASRSAPVATAPSSKSLVIDSAIDAARDSDLSCLETTLSAMSKPTGTSPDISEDMFSSE